MSQNKDCPSSLPSNHPAVSFGKVGVLLVNLGTPDGTDYWSMRRYLAEFLSDKRVIEWSRWLWYPILYGIVLSKRPQKSGAAYKEIWNNELDESPLRTITRNQSDKLGELLKDLGDNVVVDWAMRYGNPSIKSRLDALKAQGCDRILVFPLYPQYSASTTATVNDEVFRALLTMRWQPTLRIVPPYHDDDTYISSLATSITTKLAELDEEPEVVLASFHGIPQSYFDKGDPYHCHCQKTGRLLKEKLGWDDKKFQVTFQSRFGPEEWLQPYTDKTVEKLAKDGVKRIAVLNPGFVADCLETLEEIAGEAAEIFEENGGTQFTHIPCLNESAEGMATLESVVRRELQGWV
ncbi:ferrochelatase [Pseudovibrio sp. Tun.PSC04-5.I4]|uniref:ferrochelatase n=1 Tax=Pseudovibrio sp. Tun.PSC04-5.I4 TaxID=1798213 RepID=UPI00088CE180|nr:ferrochelatase [Pseudovibrio sp. Tun.PSC04-5.I4]SDR31930.1 ferrochelatase [Pseudovibrio sp. Tun.PSC04-5.I4]